MAGISLILRYQWRAFWRRFFRTRHRVQFYLTVLAVLGWALVVVLPDRLSLAARELSEGQTTSMDAVLWTFCLLWLFVLVEDASVSLTSRHLRAFPIGSGRLLVVRILSIFCSPVALLVALGSVISLWPFVFARQIVFGGAAALLLYALALGSALTASHVLAVPEWRGKLLAVVTAISIAFGAVLFTQGREGIEPLRALSPVMPPHLVSLVAVAAAPSAAAVPFLTLVAVSAIVGVLLFWSFRRSVFAQSETRAMGRAIDSELWFPGRFGGLVRAEQLYVRKLLDLWPGLLLVAAVSVASLFGPLPPIVRQSVMVIVFVFNTNVLMNCFGVNTSAEVTRYAILPLRGRDVLLVKNLGLAVIVAVQLALLIATEAWRSGLLEAGLEVLLAAVLLLSHLAWGNLISVTAPFKMHFYHFASHGDPVTAMIGGTIGSTPAVIMLFLLQAEWSWSVAAIAGAALLSLAVYLKSLDYSGRMFEHRRHIIGERLS
jgi:hypothetical protein